MSESKVNLSQVEALHIYPLKGAQPATVDGEQPDALTPLQAGFATSGFHDRELFVAAQTTDGASLAVVTPRGWDNGDGPPIRHREDGRLAAIGIDLPKDGLMELTAPDGKQLVIDKHRGTVFWDNNGLVPVHLHGGLVYGVDLGERAAEFISDALGRPAKLMRAAPHLTRLIRDGQRRSDALAADGFPYSVGNRATLRQLNALAGLAIPDSRYRSNIELDFGDEGAGEEDWIVVLRIGNQWFDVEDASLRCSVTDFNEQGQRVGGGLRVLKPRQGVKLDEKGEPIPDSEGVFYGVNAERFAVLGNSRDLRVGDSVSVDRRRQHPHVRFTNQTSTS